DATKEASEDAAEEAISQAEEKLGTSALESAVHVEVNYELLRDSPLIRRYVPKVQVGVSVDQNADVPSEMPDDHGTPFNDGKVTVQTDLGPVHVTGWKERTRTPRPLGRDVTTFSQGHELALP